MFIVDQFLGAFSHDIAIDLGTANTLVLVRGKGIMIREPTVISQHKKTKQVLAVGEEAKRMLGKTPASIVAERPLKNGVINDLEAAEALLKHFIRKVHKDKDPRFPRIPRPKVVIAIPSDVTEVERRAVQEVAFNAGAREVFLIEEPMAAAIGAKLPIEEPAGNMIVDIGGGTTEIGVISLSGLVVGRSVRVAGDEMDMDIVNYVRSRYNLLVGEKTAEGLKIESGSAFPSENESRVQIRGRDLASGLPMTIMISSGEIREALSNTMQTIIGAIKDTIEETPPELMDDIYEKGIYLTGGGSLLAGLPQLVAKETRVPATLTDDPMTTVVHGAGKVLDDVKLLEKVKITAKIT